MRGTVAAGEVERFRALVAERLGLHFDEAKMGFLADVLNRSLARNGRVWDTYLARLEAGPSDEQLGALAQELTVSESYFFRNIDQFHALREIVLPDRMRARASTNRSLSILSAGCASGEEPYSISIVARETLPDAAWNASIRAVDVNPAALKKAACARFSRWVLRETPLQIQQSWFRQDGGEAVLDDGIRRSVRFAQRNIVDEDADLWPPETYDIIFCRNVIMYFAPQAARALIARITRSLAPGGFLFLGHAETLRGLSRAFHLRHLHGAFCYQRRDGDEAMGPSIERISRAAASGPALATVLDDADSWVHAIGKSAERIQVLTELGSGIPAVHPSRRRNLGVALDLLRKERFHEALDLVQGFPAEFARDPDVLLLHAVLLTQSGELAGAEAACRRLLALDELNAGAHFVLALCREGVGDQRGARDHDQLAVYLDPAFAMPRLHLGLMARRAGDRETADRELSRALVLLEREDASRLLLFGGGFSRAALLGLCQAEINAGRG
jgi:chemotaxis protein methyltransferase CheR